MSQQELNDLKESLSSGQLKTSGLDSDTVGKLLDLENVLKSQGKSKEETEEILLKAANQGLSKEEICDIFAQVEKSDKLSKEEKDKLNQLKKSLEDNELKVGDFNADMAEKVLKLQQVLKDSALDEKEISNLLQKISDGEKIDKVDEILLRALNKDLSKDLGEAEKVLKSGNLSQTLANMTSENLKQISGLEKILKKSGKTEDEIAQILTDIATGAISDKEVDQLVKNVSKNLSAEEKKELEVLKSEIKIGLSANIRN